MMENFHIPVMLKESLDFLITNKDGKYFEGTLGFGGHSSEILKGLSDKGVLVSTDVDADAFNFCKNKFSTDNRIKLYNFNFDKIDSIAKIESITGFDGIFADLGVSSFQLDNAASGFTYRDSEAKLDLRMDKSLSVSAYDVVNSFEEESIANIIYNFGEEKNSRRLARLIVERRTQKPIDSTFELAEIIKSVTPFNFQIKTLSRVFQALRIYVNSELDVLKNFLTHAVDLLAPGGRLVILSYHSLEDRIVKDAMKYETLGCICPKDFPVCKCGKVKRLKILTKKPLLPSDEEIKSNFRARSAKLRVAEKI
jgi:16S rRNA (cytosine1402-N4)-methyltransferase